MDFEATCGYNAKRWPNEIIEFPAVLVDSETLEIVDEFRRLVRPTEKPILTTFCTELTSITQSQIEDAETISEALGSFQMWLQAHGLSGRPDLVLPVTCGDWDLGSMLPRECARKGLSVPSVLRRWCNIKRPFSAATGTKAAGMSGMLTALGLPLVGHHHLGIDDSRNIAAILRELHRRGAAIAET